MDLAPHMLAHAHIILERANSTGNSTTSSSTTNSSRPGYYKAIGLSLAVSSGLFIGTSFVLKKTGLLKANKKYNEEAGEGYGYLKNAYWWTGMTLMIIGEICNFVAYAFVDAILVTPLGALSVVITTVLSAIFLKERLSVVGKIGCFNCIIGSVVIVANAPEQSAVTDIQGMKHFVIAPGFLTYAGIIIVGCVFIALWVGPRYGKKSMLVYLSICSLIGGLSVVATQGLGAAVVAQAGGKPQFNQWFLYVLLVFVVTTLVTEIIFLNKALNIFNAALVTPTYYVFFTSATIVTSAILFQGFNGTAISITTVVMGFLQICAGVVLLQMSKSAKDVPDAAVFKGDLDQVREIAEQEQPETEPKADAIRGTAAIIRRISMSRQKMEQEEARRLREDTMKDNLEPLRENEVVEWDGLRRRKTVIGPNELGGPVRRKTIHPPLGMSRFPDEQQNANEDPEIRESQSFFEDLRHRAQSVIHPHRHTDPETNDPRSPLHPVALTEINVASSKADTPILPYGPGSFEEAQEHIYGLQPGLHKDSTQGGAPSPRSKPLPGRPQERSQSPATYYQQSLAPEQRQHANRRQFSFTNVFHRHSRTPDPASEGIRPTSRAGIGSRNSSYTHEQKKAIKSATEEERLGLVKGDSHSNLLQEHSPPRPAPTHSQSSSSASESFIPLDHNPRAFIPNASPLSEDDEDDDWQMMNARSAQQSQSPPRLREQYQRAVYQPPLSSSTAVRGQTRPAFDPFQTSSTTTVPSTDPPPSYDIPEIGSTSPDDSEGSKRRFRQQRPPTNKQGTGSGSTGASGTGVFI